MGVCPSRAKTRDAISRSTQTTYAFNCSFTRASRYYEYDGPVGSVEAPATVTLSTDFVRDVATQGPTSCIRNAVYDEFQVVGPPWAGDLIPLPSDRFNAVGHEVRRR